MWRSATIHGRSASGSAGGARRRAAALRQAAVELVELRGDVVERAGSAAASRERSCSRARSVVVLGEPRRGGAGELGLLVDAARRRDRAAGGLRLEQDARRAPRCPGTKIAVSASSAAREAPSRAVRTVDAAGEVARDRGPRRRAASSAAARPPSRAARAARAGRRGRPARSFGRSSTAIRLPLRRRREERRASTPGEIERVVAREALVGRVADRLREREQRVEPARAASRAASAPAGSREPVGRAERGDRERVGLAEREVGERRQPRLEAVDDVVAARARARARRFARTPTGTPICERREIGTAGPDGDHLARRARARGSDAPAGAQVGRAGRGREHRHVVTERAQRRRRPRRRARSRRVAATTRTVSRDRCALASQPSAAAALQARERDRRRARRGRPLRSSPWP